MESLLCLLLCLAVPTMAQTVTLTRPPSIYEQPDQVVFFKAGEPTRLPCKAHGIPKPTYTWKRNGIRFDPSGNDDRVTQIPDEGTLVFARSEDKDEGVYQCFAHNAYGTSASVRVELWMAKLEDFIHWNDVTAYPNLGSPVTLSCVPPDSRPPPSVFWAIKTQDGNVPIAYDGRVTMDLEYRLRFTNVLAKDFASGSAYVCVAINSFLRRSVEGRQHFIQPHGVEVLGPASYLWSSPEDTFGLRGSDLRLKCIFAGNPTPDVHWEKTDGSPMGNDTTVESFGQELVIKNLQFEDAGTYMCWGSNNVTRTRPSRTISVRVESAPFWLQEPQDVEAKVGGTAEFNCLAKAAPEPMYFWYINGVPLEDVTDPRVVNNPRFQRHRPDRIVFTDLTTYDRMVIQCNATNKHGYVWGDVYLNVH